MSTRQIHGRQGMTLVEVLAATALLVAMALLTMPVLRDLSVGAPQLRAREALWDTAQQIAVKEPGMAVLPADWHSESLSVETSMANDGVELPEWAPTVEAEGWSPVDHPDLVVIRLQGRVVPPPDAAAAEDEVEPETEDADP